MDEQLNHLSPPVRQAQLRMRLAMAVGECGEEGCRCHFALSDKLLTDIKKMVHEAMMDGDPTLQFLKE